MQTFTKCYDSMLQVPLQFPLQLRWRCGPDMPLRMGDYVQSVVVQGKVYVGGGHIYTDRSNNHMVMVYDISSGKWAMLPPYRAWGFAMTVINNQLVLVGGREHDNSSNKLKVLGVWRAESNEWTHPYPDMSTACYWGSSPVILSQKKGQPGTNCKRRFLKCFLHKKNVLYNILKVLRNLIRGRP